MRILVLYVAQTFLVQTWSFIHRASRHGHDGLKMRRPRRAISVSTRFLDSVWAVDHFKIRKIDKQFFFSIIILYRPKTSIIIMIVIYLYNIIVPIITREKNINYNWHLHNIMTFREQQNKKHKFVKQWKSLNRIFHFINCIDI